MFDALEQKWKQTEQVRERKHFLRISTSKNQQLIRGLTPHNENKRPTVRTVKQASK